MFTAFFQIKMYILHAQDGLLFYFSTTFRLKLFLCTVKPFFLGAALRDIQKKTAGKVTNDQELNYF